MARASAAELASYAAGGEAPRGRATPEEIAAHLAGGADEDMPPLVPVRPPRIFTPEYAEPGARAVGFGGTPAVRSAVEDIAGGVARYGGPEELGVPREQARMYAEPPPPPIAMAWRRPVTLADIREAHRGGMPLPATEPEQGSLAAYLAGVQRPAPAEGVGGAAVRQAAALPLAALTFPLQAGEELVRAAREGGLPAVGRSLYDLLPGQATARAAGEGTLPQQPLTPLMDAAMALGGAKWAAGRAAALGTRTAVPEQALPVRAMPEPTPAATEAGPTIPLREPPPPVETPVQPEAVAAPEPPATPLASGGDMAAFVAAERAARKARIAAKAEKARVAREKTAVASAPPPETPPPPAVPPHPATTEPLPAPPAPESPRVAPAATSAVEAAPEVPSPAAPVAAESPPAPSEAPGAEVSPVPPAPASVSTSPVELPGRAEVPTEGGATARPVAAKGERGAFAPMMLSESGRAVNRAVWQVLAHVAQKSEIIRDAVTAYNRVMDSATSLEPKHPELVELARRGQNAPAYGHQIGSDAQTYLDHILGVVRETDDGSAYVELARLNRMDTAAMSVAERTAHEKAVRELTREAMLPPPIKDPGHFPEVVALWDRKSDIPPDELKAALDAIPNGHEAWEYLTNHRRFMEEGVTKDLGINTEGVPDYFPRLSADQPIAASGGGGRGARPSSKVAVRRLSTSMQRTEGSEAVADPGAALILEAMEKFASRAKQDFLDAALERSRPLAPGERPKPGEGLLTVGKGESRVMRRRAGVTTDEYRAVKAIYGPKSPFKNATFEEVVAGTGIPVEKVRAAVAMFKRQWAAPGDIAQVINTAVHEQSPAEVATYRVLGKVLRVNDVLVNAFVSGHPLALPHIGNMGVQAMLSELPGGALNAIPAIHALYKTAVARARERPLAPGEAQVLAGLIGEGAPIDTHTAPGAFFQTMGARARAAGVTNPATLRALDLASRYFKFNADFAFAPNGFRRQLVVTLARRHLDPATFDILSRDASIDSLTPVEQAKVRTFAREVPHIIGDHGLRGMSPGAKKALGQVYPYLGWRLMTLPRVMAYPIRHPVGAMVNIFLAHQFLNKMLSGHYSWQNAPGNETRIETRVRDTNGDPIAFDLPGTMGRMATMARPIVGQAAAGHPAAAALQALLTPATQAAGLLGPLPEALARATAQTMTEGRLRSGPKDETTSEAARRYAGDVVSALPYARTVGAISRGQLSPGGAVVALGLEAAGMRRTLPKNAPARRGGKWTIPTRGRASGRWGRLP